MITAALPWQRSICRPFACFGSLTFPVDHEYPHKTIASFNKCAAIFHFYSVKQFFTAKNRTGRVCCTIIMVFNEHKLSIAALLHNKIFLLRNIRNEKKEMHNDDENSCRGKNSNNGLLCANIRRAVVALQKQKTCSHM